MAEPDYYKVLGLSRNASTDEIRKAYRKLAKENHPDMKPDDKSAAAKFKEIQQAYAVLGNQEKRSQYDRYGRTFDGKNPFAGDESFTWSGPGGSAPLDIDQIFGAGAGGGGGSGSMPFDLDSIFRGFQQGGRSRGSGGGGGGSRSSGHRRDPTKGKTLQMQIEIPFLLAIQGGYHEIRIHRAGKTETLSVKIPAGVESGKVMRLKGQGEPSHYGDGGVPGDLLLTVVVGLHPYYRKEGMDIFIDLPITPSEAALGARIEVPTILDGPVLLTIPPGTPSGSRLRLRGKGCRKPDSAERGDQYCVVKIVVPKHLDERARQLYEELAKVVTDSPRKHLWSDV